MRIPNCRRLSSLIRLVAQHIWEQPRKTFLFRRPRFRIYDPAILALSPDVADYQGSTTKIAANLVPRADVGGRNRDTIGQRSFRSGQGILARYHGWGCRGAPMATLAAGTGSAFDANQTAAS